MITRAITTVFRTLFTPAPATKDGTDTSDTLCRIKFPCC